MRIEKGTLTLSSSGDMAQATTSGTIATEHVGALCIQAAWSGSSPVGVLKLKGSVDNVTFTDIASQSQNVSGSTGNLIYDLGTCSFPYVQVLYTKTSGTGTLAVTFYGKGF